MSIKKKTNNTNLLKKPLNIKKYRFRYITKFCANLFIILF